MTAATARLFVSLELPSTARSALWQWAEGAGTGRFGLRLTAADDLHLTLCFLGSQPVGEIAAITAAVREACAPGAPVPVTLGGSRWLPPRRPRVLAVDLEDGSGGLARVQGALAEHLIQGGWYEPERRPFLAHVTVGRAGRSGLRSAGRPDPLPSPEPLAFTADTVALMRSHLGPGGSTYEPLANLRLGEEGP